MGFGGGFGNALGHAVQGIGGAVFGAIDAVGSTAEPAVRGIGSVAEPVVRNVVEALPYLGAIWAGGAAGGAWGGGSGVAATSGATAEGGVVGASGAAGGSGVGMGGSGLVSGQTTGVGEVGTSVADTGTGYGTANTGSYAVGDSVGYGTQAAADPTYGYGTSWGTGSSAAGDAGGSSSLLTSSNINSGVNLLSTYLQSKQAQAGTAAAANAADPFASQRPLYQKALMQLISDPASFTNTPQYQSAMSSGVSAIDRSAGARHLLGSGNRLAELMQYGQGVETTQFNSYADLLSTLSGAKTGSPAAASQALTTGTNTQMNQTNELLKTIAPMVMSYFGYGS